MSVKNSGYSYNGVKYTPILPDFADIQQSPLLSSVLAEINNKNDASSTTNTLTDLSNLQAEGIGGEAVKSRLSEMLGNIGSGVSILGDLASIYLGFQQNQLAKKQLGVQTGFANANLENTVKSYNTRLADIYRSRGYTQGDSAAATEQAITANSLNFKRIG